MNKPKLFVEMVEESSINKVRVEDEYKPEFNKLKKLFKFAFGVNGKIFKVLNDYTFYKGGYPKPDSPPKIKSLLDTIGYTYRFYQLKGIEDNTINSYLKTEFGIEIKGITPNSYESPQISKMKKFEALYREVFNDDYDGETKQLILNKLIESGQSLQASICEDNDEVKIKNAEIVENECEVSKSNFMTAVNAKYKSDRNNTDIEEAITDIENKKTAMDEAISVLEVLGEKNE
jgi:hypothetical protein